MAMRETVATLRAYFILSGLLSFTIHGSSFQLSLKRPTTLADFFDIGFSLAFLYVGLLLPKLLKSSADRIVAFLYVTGGWSVLAYLLGLLHGENSPVTLILTLLILWYLLKNLRRLTAEAQTSPSGVTPSGA